MHGSYPPLTDPRCISAAAPATAEEIESRPDFARSGESCRAVTSPGTSSNLFDVYQVALRRELARLALHVSRLIAAGLPSTTTISVSDVYPLVWS